MPGPIPLTISQLLDKKAQLKRDICALSNDYINHWHLWDSETKSVKKRQLTNLINLLQITISQISI